MRITPRLSPWSSLTFREKIKVHYYIDASCHLGQRKCKSGDSIQLESASNTGSMARGPGGHRKLSAEELMLLNCGVEKTLESPWPARR